MKILRRVLAFLASLVCMVASAQPAGYPSRPVRIVVPFTAGSATDSVARIVAEMLSKDLGQPVVVENKPGAGGTVGAGSVAKAPPDGYTLLVHSAGHVANPSLYQNLPYDTLRDFACVTMLANLPNVVVTAPSKGFRNLQDLVAKAKAAPGTLNYATAGIGSATHMNTEMFRAAAQFDAVHVPFKGTPEAIGETIAGRVDFFFAPLGGALSHIKAGTLQPLAVGSVRRSPLLPEVPTTLEAGYPDSEYLFWIGFLAPAATPRAIVERLNASARRALAAPEAKEKLALLGADAMPMTPQACDEFIGVEARRAAEVIKKAGIKAQ